MKKPGTDPLPGGYPGEEQAFAVVLIHKQIVKIIEAKIKGSDDVLMFIPNMIFQILNNSQNHSSQNALHL